jgi:hypothetical protein
LSHIRGTRQELFEEKQYARASTIKKTFFIKGGRRRKSRSAKKYLRIYLLMFNI